MRFTLFAAGLLVVALSQSGCKKDGSTNNPDGECAGLCGKGTRCDGSVCVVDYSQDICAAPGDVEEHPVVPMKPPITSWGECYTDRSELPKKFKPVDDSKIPQFDPNAARALEMGGGDEQINEAVLNSHMREVEYAINDCLALASCYQGSSLPNGRLDFQFRLTGAGKVESIAVTAPPGLSVFGVIPCVRKAVADHAFPTYNGPTMTVKYNVEIGGVE